MVTYKAGSRGKSIKKAGLCEFRFTRGWSFTKKGHRAFLGCNAKLTKNLLKKGIIKRVEHK